MDHARCHVWLWPCSSLDPERRRAGRLPGASIPGVPGSMAAGPAVRVHHIYLICDKDKTKYYGAYVGATKNLPDNVYQQQKNILRQAKCDMASFKALLPTQISIGDGYRTSGPVQMKLWELACEIDEQDYPSPFLRVEQTTDTCDGDTTKTKGLATGPNKKLLQRAARFALMAACRRQQGEQDDDQLGVKHVSWYVETANTEGENVLDADENVAWQQRFGERQ